MHQPPGKPCFLLFGGGIGQDPGNCGSPQRPHRGFLDHPGPGADPIRIERRGAGLQRPGRGPIGAAAPGPLRHLRRGAAPSAPGAGGEFGGGISDGWGGVAENVGNKKPKRGGRRGGVPKDAWFPAKRVLHARVCVCVCVSRKEPEDRGGSQRGGRLSQKDPKDIGGKGSSHNAER